MNVPRPSATSRPIEQPVAPADRPGLAPSDAAAATTAPPRTGPADRARLAEPPLPPDAGPRDSGLAGPVAIGVGIAVLGFLGSAIHPPTDPSLVAPVLSAFVGFGELTIAAVAAGLTYVGIRTAGAPLPKDEAAPEPTKRAPPEPLDQ